MARFLVTGSRGVIGTYLVSMLKNRGHDVFGIDLPHAPGEAGFIQKMGIEKSFYSRCDVADFRHLQRVFETFGPFDYVYHTAAEFGRWNGEDYYEQLWRSNAIGTKNVIRLQEKYGFRLIHFSSSEVYGDYEGIMREEVLDELPIKQLNDYAMSKWVNELQIRNSRILKNTQTVIVRLFNTYGPGEWYHPYRSVNCKFCYHALHGLPITVYKNYYRTSTYLEDTCRTICNISDNFKDGAVYNIGGLEYHSIEELADAIWKLTGASPALIETKESEALTTRSKQVDISKAIADLDHKLTVKLEDGVAQTIDWMRNFYNLQADKSIQLKAANQ